MTKNKRKRTEMLAVARRLPGTGGIAAPAASNPAVRAVMQGNRRTNTLPELQLRRELHARGLRYFVDRPVSAGMSRVRPDLVFPRAKVAVFVDGCFWHGCPRHGTMPRQNQEFWSEKIARNKARDARVTRALRRQGWQVVRIWEHETVETGATRVERVLRARPLV